MNQREAQRQASSSHVPSWQPQCSPSIRASLLVPSAASSSPASSESLFRTSSPHPAYRSASCHAQNTHMPSTPRTVEALLQCDTRHAHMIPFSMLLQLAQHIPPCSAQAAKHPACRSMKSHSVMFTQFCTQKVIKGSYARRQECTFQILVSKIQAYLLKIK